MATPTHFGTVLAEFTAMVHRSKNRQVSIPSETQRELGLEKRRENHLLLVSIRASGGGRWNHHYFKLSFDNEFSIPSDVTHIASGDPIDVKVHRIIADVEVDSRRLSGASTLAELARRPRKGWREDGSSELDRYLNDEISS